MKKTLLLFVLIAGYITIANLFWDSPNYYHQEFRENKNVAGAAYAYPPAVGILGNAPNCKSCHVNNGPWSNEAQNIIDILDKDTKKSLKQPDGTFEITVKRNTQKTVLTVIGHKKEKNVSAPYRNAWLYIDPTTIGKNTLSKFAPGWDVNLPMSCRLVGDKLQGYDDADITSLPMTIQPLADAKNTELQLQVMLTKGESVKGNAQEGMLGNYFERKVKLIVQ